MKVTLYLLTLSICSFGLSSCCSVCGIPTPHVCSTSAIAERKASDSDSATAEKKVTTSSHSSSAYTVYDYTPNTTRVTNRTRYKTAKAANNHTLAHASSCSSCGSSFHPVPGRCGKVNPKVLSRASAQASGEPHIGLIPTMKDLAPSD